MKKYTAWLLVAIMLVCPILAVVDSELDDVETTNEMAVYVSDDIEQSEGETKKEGSRGTDKSGKQRQNDNESRSDKISKHIDTAMEQNNKDRGDKADKESRSDQQRYDTPSKSDGRSERVSDNTPRVHDTEATHKGEKHNHQSNVDVVLDNTSRNNDEVSESYEPNIEENGANLAEEEETDEPILIDDNSIVDKVVEVIEIKSDDKEEPTKKADDKSANDDGEANVDTALTVMDIKVSAAVLNPNDRSVIRITQYQGSDVKDIINNYPGYQPTLTKSIGTPQISIHQYGRYSIVEWTPVKGIFSYFIFAWNTKTGLVDVYMASQYDVSKPPITSMTFDTDENYQYFVVAISTPIGGFLRWSYPSGLVGTGGNSTSGNWNVDFDKHYPNLSNENFVVYSWAEAEKEAIKKQANTGGFTSNAQFVGYCESIFKNYNLNNSNVANTLLRNVSTFFAGLWKMSIPESQLRTDLLRLMRPLDVDTYKKVEFFGPDGYEDICYELLGLLKLGPGAGKATDLISILKDVQDYGNIAAESLLTQVYSEAYNAQLFSEAILSTLLVQSNIPVPNNIKSAAWQSVNYFDNALYNSVIGAAEKALSDLAKTAIIDKNTSVKISQAVIDKMFGADDKSDVIFLLANMSKIQQIAEDVARDVMPAAKAGDPVALEQLKYATILFIRANYEVQYEYTKTTKNTALADSRLTEATAIIGKLAGFVSQ